ncbi:BglG family transcription antiterminator [Periweissella ghanensis]|uniref:Transcriptional regulator MtlR n=2 Tax=Periweissella ghanensis TaxID=467997 RepID=A0ABM8ZCL3_9LACO|nr:BglG family transcription antiterminator [Periweissella ghanensis]CAH0418408.1 Transcriptional regulator MtlR [Periweissella ghanensis]
MAEMWLTEREEKIVEVLLQSGPQTVKNLLDVTKMSRRTLYRDLQNLQTTLPKYGAFLIKKENGYQLQGDLAAFKTAEKLIEWTQSSRNVAELILLLMDQASLTQIMTIFGISQPTATADFKIIEQNVSRNGAQLSREKGLHIIGSEFTKRSLMVSALKKGLTTIETLKMTPASFSDNKLVNRLPYERFALINAAFDAEDLHNISDRTQALIRLFFITSLIRIESGKPMPTDIDNHPSKEALEFVTRIVKHLPANQFKLPEILYLASITDSLYFQQNDNLLFDEKYDTDFINKVRQLITEVSAAVNIEFGRDNTLFSLLNAHLRSIFIVPQLFEDEKSTFIQSIQAEHPRIFAIVDKALTKVFNKQFPLDEVAFITLHFTSTLERSSVVLPMRAALITDRGRISAEFFARTLQTQFPFIESIQILQQSNFDEQMAANYDLVFTTKRISGDYIKVDPDFQASNFSEIAQAIRKVRAKMDRRHEQNNPQQGYLNIQDFLQQSQQIITDFNVQELVNPTDFTGTIQSIINNIAWIDRKADVVDVLVKRFTETPFGIPDTNIALVHGVSADIAKPYFAIVDLKQPIDVLGSDKVPMTINRILVLMAPKNVNEITNSILGRITSSIVEYSLYTAIYRSGNYEIVYELLNKIINETLQNYGALAGNM